MKSLILIAFVVLVLANPTFGNEPKRLFGLDDTSPTVKAVSTQESSAERVVYDKVCVGGVCRLVPRVERVTGIDNSTVPVPSPPKDSYEPTRIRAVRTNPARWLDAGGPRWTTSGQTTASHLINDHGVPAWRVMLMTPRRRQAVHSQLHNGQSVFFIGAGFRRGFFRRR